MSYQLLLLEKSQGPPHKAIAWFQCARRGRVRKSQDTEEWFSDRDLTTLRQRLETLEVVKDQSIKDDDRRLRFGATRTGNALDSSFRDVLADTMRAFIESVTPVVVQIVQEKNDREG